MAKIKEYYPSLTTSEYKLGEYYMFIRNWKYHAKKIGNEQKKYISEIPKGGLALDPEEEGGLALDNGEITEEGGLAIDTDEVGVEPGGLALDFGDEVSSSEVFENLNKKKKVYADFSYEAGRILGINKNDAKLYVQFANTEPGYCHIFKAGLPSDDFDIIERLIQNSGE